MVEKVEMMVHAENVNKLGCSCLCTIFTPTRVLLRNYIIYLSQALLQETAGNWVLWEEKFQGV